MANKKISIMEKMCNEHNEKHPTNGILTIRKEISSYSIGLGMVPILSGLNEDQAFWCLAAIKNYADAQ
jgi:hypothetical protein